MFQADIGDDRNQRLNDICSVEATSQARFDNGNLDIALRKVVESHCGGHLEEGELQTLHLCLVAVHKIDNLLLGNHLAIHSDALTEVGQVGRGEQARMIARLLQHRRQHIRHRALAVGAGNMNYKVVALWVANRTAKLRNTLQARFVGIASDLLERRHRRK